MNPSILFIPLWISLSSVSPWTLSAVESETWSSSLSHAWDHTPSKSWRPTDWLFFTLSTTPTAAEASVRYTGALSSSALLFRKYSNDVIPARRLRQMDQSSMYSREVEIREYRGERRWFHIKFFHHLCCCIGTEVLAYGYYSAISPISLNYGPWLVHFDY